MRLILLGVVRGCSLAVKRRVGVVVGVEEGGEVLASGLLLALTGWFQPSMIVVVLAASAVTKFFIVARLAGLAGC